MSSLYIIYIVIANLFTESFRNQLSELFSDFRRKNTFFTKTRTSGDVAYNMGIWGYKLYPQIPICSVSYCILKNYKTPVHIDGIA